MRFLSGTSHYALICMLAVGPASTALGQQAGRDPEAVFAAECAFFLDQTHEMTDYRLRDTSQGMRNAYLVNWEHHTEIALRRIRNGEYSRDVMADLDWTLKRWPNHMLAINGLLKYEFSGGARHGFAPTECYFQHAMKFAPEDLDVMMAHAYYYHRKKDFKRAEAGYLEVLAKRPNSMEGHYNLGLLYIDMSNLPKALEHAQIAYDEGYPLPGLRQKLEKAGAWKPVAPKPPEGQAAR